MERVHAAQQIEIDMLRSIVKRQPLLRRPGPGNRRASAGSDGIDYKVCSLLAVPRFHPKMWPRWSPAFPEWKFLKEGQIKLRIKYARPNGAFTTALVGLAIS